MKSTVKNGEIILMLRPTEYDFLENALKRQLARCKELYENSGNPVFRDHLGLERRQLESLLQDLEDQNG